MDQAIEIVLGNLAIAVNLLEQSPEFASLIPEVRVNLVYALPQAQTPQDVAAIEGRITRVRGLPFASGKPSFGASDHMARLILEVRKFDTNINAGINFKCDQTVIAVVKDYCHERGWIMGLIDRTREPSEVAEQDGSSMPWKIKQLVTSSGSVPRVFYEGEGWGKEPLFVIVGKDAVEVTEIAIDIARRYQKKVRN